MERDTEDVYLSHLKFAGTQNTTDSSKKPTPSPYQPSRSSSSKATQRLAADKPGEELAPDAAIWCLYQDQSNEYDRELVDNKNRNLDMMLLFVSSVFSPVCELSMRHFRRHCFLLFKLPFWSSRKTCFNRILRMLL